MTITVSRFSSRLSVDDSAHADRLHLFAKLCDARISRYAQRMAQPPSAPVMLADLHARSLPRAQDLGRDGSMDTHHITAWRWARLLKATYGNVHLIIMWLAYEIMATLPPPKNGILYLFGDGSHADKRGTKNPRVQKGCKSKHQPWFFGIRFVLLMVAWDGYRVPLVSGHISQSGLSFELHVRT
jgi:hypothetical protein